MARTGRCTTCDLSNMTPLCLPWTDENGLLRPRFSHKAVLLSFELAAAAYDLNLDAWREAGWRDISYQVDNTLLTGEHLNNNGGGLGGIFSEYLHHLAQARLKRQNPISQLRGALRQREKADTCKAVVMLHPLPAGQYLVAIGFMGTGKRIYDWFSNFRLNQEEGMHAGFLQLTKEFEKNCESISFPETARELKLDKLTLNDILMECRRPDSRFRLWMAGHSQGGSIMQLFAWREIQRGFLRQHMIGYGFASPSVIYTHPACDLTAYPLFHIINADDVFPRIGALLHIGSCRVFMPDEGMREACFRAVWQQPVFRAVSALMRQVAGSGNAFLLVSAMLLALQDVSADEAMTVLNGLAGAFLPDRLAGALGGRREEILAPMIRKVGQGYALATGGEEMPAVSLGILRGRIAALIRTHGAQHFAKACMQSLALPHKLRGVQAENGIASYQYIVTQRFDELLSKTWCPPLNRLNPPMRSTEKHVRGGRFARLTSERREKARRTESHKATNGLNH